MTRFFNSSIKTKLIVLLTVLCLLFSCLGLYACGNDNEVKDPTYSTEEEADDVIIKNATFSVGTYSAKPETFPLVSPKGWGKVQADNSSPSSTVTSGVVDTATDSWSTLLKTLYADQDFVSYLKNKFGFTEEDLYKGIREEVGDNDYQPKNEELRDYAIKTYVNVTNEKGSFANPGVSPEATDDYVYMLNNVAKSANFNLGLAQKVTSASIVNLEADKVYALSVWVKTANIAGQGDLGANIRLANTFNSKTQAEYRISNIIANEWTKYTIYVKTDAKYTGTFTLTFGLGYGNGNANACDYFTEGTAYFDDITITEMNAKDFNESITATNMVIGEEEPIEANLVKKTDTHYACLYEMNLAYNESSYLSDLNSLVATSDFTTSNVTVDDGNGNKVPLTSKIKVGDTSTQELTQNNGSYTVSVNKASATLKVEDSSFILNNEEYALISFYLKNELVGPADTNVFIDVIDVYSGITLKRASILTVEEPTDNFNRYILLLKNNFTTGGAREFYLNIIVGTNDVASVVYDSDFSTGSVTVKDFKIAKDSLDTDLANKDYENIYTFLSGAVNATVALHAGYEEDYNEDNSVTTYNFSTRPGNFGDIMFNPTAVKDYAGIVPNHTYITNTDGAETHIDTRCASGKDYNVDGVAGLINTKYLDNYDNGAEIKSKLGYTDGDKDMQLIMIKNNNANHYGFVGKKLTVNAGNYGSVDVSLRVCDGATAYIYLSDVSGIDKNVLTFNDFTVNTDVVNGVEKGTEVDGSSLRYELKVTSDMMNANGFVTVSFYVGAGATAKSYRVEIWNGARDGKDETASQGYVFVNNVVTSTATGFTEGESWNSTFSVSGNPLYNNHRASFDVLYAYERVLNELEIQYNKENPKEAISYSPNYVWAKSETVVYGVFNTIDPIANDPYADEEEEEDTAAGCVAESDPSTFWLSFSSILLAVVLFAAILVLILRRSALKRKANKSDALSHYKVTSRIRTSKQPNTEKSTEETTPIEDKKVETESLEMKEIQEEKPTEETSNEEEYIYGEVQSFGEEKEENKEETSSNEDNN